MDDNGNKIAAGCIVLMLACVMIYFQVGVWRECRAEHSWWYCMNLVSR